jgi:hypothetical protein
MNPKNDRYCPMPAAIVAIPNIEDIKYNSTREVDTLIPNIFEKIE